MTPATVGALMQRATKLLRAHKLTPYDTEILRQLVFCCGRRGGSDVIVPLVKLAKLGGMSKPTAVQAIDRLTRCGLVLRVRRRSRIGWAWRVAANLYRLLAPATESTGLATTQGLRKTGKGSLPDFEGSDLDLALQRLGRGIQAALTPPSWPEPAAQ